jgi:hypothetical protein
MFLQLRRGTASPGWTSARFGEARPLPPGCRREEGGSGLTDRTYLPDPLTGSTGHC